MKVFITGKNGQLGRELQKRCPENVELFSFSREELDITDAQVVQEMFAKVSPDVVINAAAYTAVDKAESEAELAFSINAKGPGVLAAACEAIGARFIHVSTDFVFDGSQSTPYKTDDPIAPLGVYGESKAEGEQAVLAASAGAVIVRTAWVYAAHGNNFANTMLRLMGERENLSVVADQIGTPTSTTTLAAVLYGLAKSSDAKGIYHCTDAGVASWYDFAVAIYEEGKALGVLEPEKSVNINPISTSDYPTPAKRPAYSVLDKARLADELQIDFQHWREVLRKTLKTKGLSGSA